MTHSSSRKPSPLSAARQQAWLLGLLAPESPLVHVPIAVRLTGELDEDALRDALRIAAAADPALGECFTVTDGVPLPTASTQPVLPVTVHDLRDLERGASTRRAEELMAAAARAPFDLADGPTARAVLIRAAAREHTLLLVLHRMAGDHGSAAALLGRTFAAYSSTARVHTAADALAPVAEAPAGPPPESGASVAPRDLPPVPELPLDRPRPERRALAAEAVPFEVPTATVEALRALGAASGAELPAVLLALFETLLHRYSGQHALAVATDLSRWPTTPAAPGPQETLAAVRCEVTGRQSFTTVLEAARHALDRGADTVAPESPLTLLGRPGFSFHEAPKLVTTTDLAPEFIHVHNGAALGDMTLEFIQDGDRLAGQLCYATDVLDPSSARRILDHYQTLMAGALAAPDQPVAELPLLSAAEQDVIAALNGESADVPQETFHQIFEAQVDRTPDAIAVRSQQAALTYAELNALANQMAHLLRESGVGPEVTTGICLDRSVELIVAVLGVLKAGGAYVPVDPRDPTERRAGILRDARVKTVVASGTTTLPGHQVIELDGAWTALAGRPVDNVPTPPSAASNAAYLLYTSGSTGRPKGVIVENRQLVSYTYSVLRRLGIDGPLRYAMVQPLTVDSSVTALVPPLCTGGEVHVLSRECALDASKLADWVQTHGVDFLKIAPSHLRALQTSPRFADLLPGRYLVIGGEASDWRWMRSLQRLVPQCKVINHYGPTETTVGVLTLAVADHPDAQWDITPLGVPLPGTSAHVVDEAGRAVPIGVTGELLIGGVNLARGYHQQHDLTAAAFISDSLGEGSGERLYRTGDVVRRLRDGSIEFLGRRDDQVKVRGFRVALGEIEAALNAHGEVRGAVAVVREDVPGDRRVVAYVAPRTPEVFDTADLDRHLRARLSPHMIPQAMVVLDELPLSAHGKIDRSALPAPASGPDRPTLPPQNERERLVADIWTELLPGVSVGMEQNFFDIGGHSLLLVALQHKLQALTGREVELLDLFRHTSVRAQAAFLGERDDATAPRAARAATHAGSSLPLTTKAAGVQQNALMKRRQQQLRARRGRTEE
ncbi:amino acid adenylation domain-containing protein [Streptomyces sp. NPDC001904]|uniref:non-ribosomal peptide synthetase n=1 Tax=Streptomyces sp. NPDC001904 TaxID=3154531 RepID=UPI0033220F47